MKTDVDDSTSIVTFVGLPVGAVDHPVINIICMTVT